MHGLRVNYDLRFVGNDTNVVIDPWSNKLYLARFPVNNCFSRFFTTYVNLLKLEKQPALAPLFGYF